METMNDRVTASYRHPKMLRKGTGFRPLSVPIGRRAKREQVRAKKPLSARLPLPAPRPDLKNTFIPSSLLNSSPSLHLHSQSSFSDFILIPTVIPLPSSVIASILITTMAPVALPTELLDLLALHASFLTALSLHYAHRGIAVPVDLRELAPSITSIWKKRNVTMDDIRLCVGVLGSGPNGQISPFYLSDFTRGKYCLEIQKEYRLSGAMGQMGALNENALQTMFMENLDHLWRIWNDSPTTPKSSSARPMATPKRRTRNKKVEYSPGTVRRFAEDSTLPEFLSQLPLAAITLISAAVELAPLQDKGRKRLREIQECVQQSRSPKKMRETTGKENTTALLDSHLNAAKATETLSARKANLLDRIMAKEAAKAAGPTPLSPTQLQHRAALQRSEEILNVLTMLAASKGPVPRVSLSMGALIQTVQGSLRSPLSKDEVMKVIEVLSNEVAPGYVNFVRLGAISSVVINKSMRPRDVRGTLQALGVEA